MDSKPVTTNGEETMEKLWCIHIPGPDDIYAAKDEADAKRMAGVHNDAVRKYLDQMFTKRPRDDNDMPDESLMASVIEWPHDPQSHADDLLAQKVSYA